MNRADLIDHLAQKHDLTKAEAGRIFGTLLTVIMATVKKGEDVSVLGFGTFKKVGKSARKGFNPRTKAPIKIPARSVVKFTPGSKFKAAVDPKDAKRRAAK